MATKRTVDIKLHPLSWKVLQQQYNYDGYAVDLGRGWLYKVVTKCLRRHPVMSPWEFSRAPKGMVDGKVYILEYDYNRFGGYMSTASQANLSVIIFRRERERLCHMTATAHVMAGVSRDTAMRYFLDKEGYDDHEISFAALRKHYQRHFRHFEDDMLHDLKELKSKNQHKSTQ